MSFKIPDLHYNLRLMNIIKEYGKDLCSINLLIDAQLHPIIDYIIEGCPKLKTLTLESLRDSNFWFWRRIFIPMESLEALYKGCKELKDLKLTKIYFEDTFTEEEIKKILPDCNVELKESSGAVRSPEFMFMLN